ncbi:hypothetical protein L1887_13982 [Cichorium endivia]|nr:hypothetical protein L1887_13982 [Cichorium endivia]
MERRGSRRVADNFDNQGRTIVGRRKQKSVASVRRGNEVNLVGVGTSFFVATVPEGWSAKELWIVFQQLGYLVNVYIAQKKNILGQRFGFAIFIRVSNEVELEKELNNIVIGWQKLQVNIAKFKRKKISIGEAEKWERDSRNEEDGDWSPPCMNMEDVDSDSDNDCEINHGDD